MDRSLQSNRQGRPRRGSEHHVRDARKRGQARRHQQCTHHHIRMPRARRRSVRTCTGACAHDIVRASGSGQLPLDFAMPPHSIILVCCIVYITLCSRTQWHVHRAYKHNFRREQQQPRGSYPGRPLRLLPWLPCIFCQLGCRPQATASNISHRGRMGLERASCARTEFFQSAPRRGVRRPGRSGLIYTTRSATGLVNNVIHKNCLSI